MRRLPPELYREIIEYLNQDDILTLVLVSRTFQAEAERLLFGKIMIDSNPYDPAKRDVVKHCTRLIALPRIWPLVRWVYIRRISKGRASLEVVSRVADLLEKLTNVTKLHVRDPGNAWPLCGKLFRGCSFRLRYLSCHFLLDKDFASFLDSQPSLYEFEWAPLYDLDSRTSQRYELPPSTLPLLAIYLSVGKEIRTDDILPGRPIAHFRGYNLGRRATEVLHDLVRSIVPLKSLHIHPMDADFLCLLPVAFPFLEYLGPVNLDEPEVDDAFFLRVLPSLKHLHRVHINDSRRNQNDTVIKAHTACPSLGVISISHPAGGEQTVFEWAEDSQSWVQPRAWRDLWMESAHTFDRSLEAFRRMKWK